MNGFRTFLIAVMGTTKIEEAKSRLADLLLKRSLGEKDNEDEDKEITTLLAELIDTTAAIKDYNETRGRRLPLFVFVEDAREIMFGALLLLIRERSKVFWDLPCIQTDENLPDFGDPDVRQDELEAILEENLTHGQDYRLSDEIVLPASLSEIEAKKLLSYVTFIAQANLSYLEWKKNSEEAIILPVTRALAKKTGSLDFFYTIASIWAESLNYGGRYQQARDFAEEILFCSIQDGVPAWGYLILSLTFSGERSLNKALLYANLSLSCFLNAELVTTPSRKKFFIWLLRLYRNCHMYPFVVELYSRASKELKLTDDDFFGITHTYFTTLIAVRNPKFFANVFEYLTNNREFIFRRGENVAVPLLAAIYEAKRILGSVGESEMLTDWIRSLELIVGPEQETRLRILLNGTTERLKEILIQNLSKMTRTRDAIDFVSDVKNSMPIADKIVELSVQSQDVTAFLVSMLLKADYSQTLFAKESEGTPLMVKWIDTDEEENPLSNLSRYADEIEHRLELKDDERLIWLGDDNATVHSLQLDSSGWGSIERFDAWTIKAMWAWLDDRNKILDFNTTVVNQTLVEPYNREMQLRDTARIQASLQFVRTPLDTSKILIFVKDASLSAMPQNLLLDKHGEFLASRQQIACIPSAEWLVQNRDNEIQLGSSFQGAIWIPVAMGDMTLNYLWRDIEPIFSEWRFEKHTDGVPEKPLDKDINIICAHGGETIADTSAIFLNEDAVIMRPDRIVGEGKVLIMLVCHSGSMKKALLEDQIFSLANKFLWQGYQAVIAPFWSLHTDIPPIWLPIFLENVSAGRTLSRAVWEANHTVKEEIDNPGAWACLHFYGDPEFTLVRTDD